MTDTYFLIRGTEDGTVIDELEGDELNDHVADLGITSWREEFSDTNYWQEDEALLIKGEIVVPKPKKKVVEWDF